MLDTCYSKFMTLGKRVVSDRSGERYTIWESHAEKEKEGYVKCVSDANLGRYKLLKAWEGNRVGLTEVQEKIMYSYEVFLKISEVSPADRIRFITSDYETKFFVRDFGFVKIDGKAAQVIYIDDCHFAFLHEKGRGSVYHICQYAEILEANGSIIEPIG